ncbi:MAG: TetR/AcrR family transcriptional regulator [Actinomycetota bacterium]|nr:TetR/AcrR family transcriptional regulator [Actinomycetota bacterium]
MTGDVLLPRTAATTRRQSAGGADTREQILAVSAALFAQRGIAGTTMRAIAAGCSIKAASLYHHFASKDELVAEIMMRSSAHVVALYDEIRAAELPPAERVEALMRATLRNFREHRQEARMFYENPAYVATAPLLQKVRDEALANDALWVQAIDDAIADGTLRSDIDRVRLKVLLRNMMLSTASGIDPTRIGDVTDDVVTILLRGAFTPPNAIPRSAG